MNNTEIIQRLLDERHITVEEAMQLMRGMIHTYPVYPIYPTYPTIEPMYHWNDNKLDKVTCNMD